VLEIVYRNDAGDKVVQPLQPGATLVVGRGADADLRIRNPSISRSHAKIWESAGRWFVKDLGSSNFTFVNGEQVTETTFQEGDVVRFGDFQVRIQGDGSSGGGRRSRRSAADPTAEIDEGRSRRSRPSPATADDDDGGRRSRRSRPGAEDVPSRRPRPGEDDDIPSRRPRPGDDDDIPSRRSRPGVDEVPSRRPRPGDEEVPSRRPRPGDDDVPSRRPRPGSEEIPSRRSRTRSEPELPRRAPEPEPARPELPPRREAPAARSASMVGVDPAELRAAQSKANKLEEALKDARIRLEEQVRRIDELESREGRFDSEIAGWNDRYNRVREQLDHTQELLDRAKEEVGEQEATIEAFEREVSELEAQIQQVEATREADSGQLSDLKSKVVQKDRRIDELQRELDLMEFDLRSARDELESIQDSMNHENTETRKLERELALLREVIQEKENIIKELQIEIEEQERQIYDLRMGTGVKDLEQARTEMLEKYFEKNREAEDLRKRLSEIEKKYANMEADLADYEDRLAESKDITQHPDFQRKLRELDRMQGDLDEAREQAEKLEKRLESFGPDAKAKLDAELNFLRRKNQALEDKVEQLESASEGNAATSAELNFAKRKGQALEEKVEELTRQLEEAREALEEAREAAREAARAAATAAPAPSISAGDSTSQTSSDKAIRIDAIEAVDELLELFGSWKSNVTLLKSYVGEAREASDDVGAVKGSLESINEVLTVIQADANDMRRELSSLHSLLSVE